MSRATRILFSSLIGLSFLLRITRGDITVKHEVAELVSRREPMSVNIVRSVDG